MALLVPGLRDPDLQESSRRHLDSGNDMLAFVVRRGSQSHSEFAVLMTGFEPFKPCSSCRIKAESTLGFVCTKLINLLHLILDIIFSIFRCMAPARRGLPESGVETSRCWWINCRIGNSVSKWLASLARSESCVRSISRSSCSPEIARCSHDKHGGVCDCNGHLPSTLKLLASQVPIDLTASRCFLSGFTRLW